MGKAVADRLILWGEIPPPDLDLEIAWGKLESSRLTIVVGNDDHYVDPSQLLKAEARLLEHEIPYETIMFEGGHHLDARKGQNGAKYRVLSACFVPSRARAIMRTQP